MAGGDVGSGCAVACTRAGDKSPSDGCAGGTHWWGCAVGDNGGRRSGVPAETGAR